MILAAVFAAGCSSDSKDSTRTDSSAQLGVTQRMPGDSAADLQWKRSGVRVEDLQMGTGKEVDSGAFVEFDYSCWTADGTGTRKVRSVASSIGRPGESFKAQVGVHPLPALSEGIVGMREGGTRRIYIPGELGFQGEAPYAGYNLIFEVVGIKEVPQSEVDEYQGEQSRRMEYLRHLRDSLIQLHQSDSLGQLGVDSLGWPPQEIEVPGEH
jgi:hypothetical protein